MILDKIENLGLYSGVNPYINKVVEFLSNNDIMTMPAGRVEICGTKCYANFDIAHGKTKAEALLETHNQMLDIQLILDGEEQIGWSPRAALPQAEYDASRDISFYPGCCSQQYLSLRKGEFLLFLPGDAHAPCITPEESYRKVIFKLALTTE